jgi:Tol biopolymer transport system component
VAAEVPGDQEHPDWSPDGNSIAFETDFATVWIAPIGDGRARRVFTCVKPCASVQDAAWSPDGKTIAVTRASSTNDSTTDRSSITLIDVASGTTRDLYVDNSHTVWLFHPRWSGDGSKLVFEEDTFASDKLSEETVTRRRIATIPAAGGSPTFLTGVSGSDPDWSPTEDVIVFTSQDNLYLVRPDGSDLHQLTDYNGTSEHAIQPTFDPDGKSITFTYVTGTMGTDDQAFGASVKIDGTATAKIDGLSGATHTRLST